MIFFTKDKFYIVTGASSGIGKAAALLLNELGASVVAIARNKERLEEMKSNCKNPQNMYLEIKDLTEDMENLPQYVKNLKEKYGKFSGMAYCAGIGIRNSIFTIDLESIKKIFDINYVAPIMMTKGVADKRNNIGKGCSLVYLSSIDAKLSSKGQPLYAGSKSALSATIKSMSKEVIRYGIRMNCILPSIIETPMTINDEYNKNEITEQYPLGWGKPEDAANMTVFLLSDKSKYISGQNYILDSGGVLWKKYIS